MSTLILIGGLGLVVAWASGLGESGSAESSWLSEREEMRRDRREPIR